MHWWRLQRMCLPGMGTDEIFGQQGNGCRACHASLLAAGVGEDAAKQKREDWVRPMALAGHEVLYIGTHRGRLQRVHLPARAVPERWEHLWDNGRGEALMCLAVRRHRASL